MVLFMSGINLVVSAFDAALPGLIIPNPKNRMKVVYISMLILWKDTRIAQTLPFCLDMEMETGMFKRKNYQKMLERKARSNG